MNISKYFNVLLVLASFLLLIRILVAFHNADPDPKHRRKSYFKSMQNSLAGCESESHRRRINTEEKAKVVAAAWVTELIQFLAKLAILH